MLGDVWFASGQSNMEFPLKGFDGAPLRNAAAEITAATDPHVRLLRIEHKSSSIPLRDIDANWTTTTPATAIDFSAIGYFFAREIAAREHVTVGVIDSTWGGTPADSWVSTDAFATDATLAPAIDARARFQQDQTDADLATVAEAPEDAAILASGGKPPTHPCPPPRMRTGRHRCTTQWSRRSPATASRALFILLNMCKASTVTLGVARITGSGALLSL